MVVPPVCSSCGALGVGERCARCGARMKPGPPSTEMGSVAVPGLELAGLADASQTSPAVESPRHRAASAYLQLQPSEQAVLRAASRIFAAFIASGAVTDENQNDVSDRAVKLATRMALVIEKYIQSDNEDW